MKIEITAEQAQMILSAMINEIWSLTICIAPKDRQQSRINAAIQLRNTIAINMLKCGFIDQAYYNMICAE